MSCSSSRPRCEGPDGARHQPLRQPRHEQQREAAQQADHGQQHLVHAPAADDEREVDREQRRPGTPAAARGCPMRQRPRTGRREAHPAHAQRAGHRRPAATAPATGARPDACAPDDARRRGCAGSTVIGCPSRRGRAPGAAGHVAQADLVAVAQDRRAHDRRAVQPGRLAARSGRRAPTDRPRYVSSA